MNPNHEVKLPPAIQKQGDSAKQLHEKVYQAPTEGTPAAQPAPAPMNPVEPVQQQFSDQGAPPVPPAMQPPPAPLHTQAEPENDYRQQYLVLKGKYDSEVPRLIQELNEAKQRMQTIENRMQGYAKMQAVSQGQGPVDYNLTEEEQELVSPEMVSLVEKVARAQASAQVQPVMHSQHQVKSDAFDQALKSTIPDFEEINNDPDFVSWMQKTPVLGTKAVYGDFFRDAVNSFDVQRTADIMKHYRAQSQPRQPVQQVQQPIPEGLRNQIQPPVNQGMQPPLQQQQAPQPVSLAWMQQFFTDVAKGVYDSQPEKKSQYEQLINEATRTGNFRD